MHPPQPKKKRNTRCHEAHVGFDWESDPVLKQSQETMTLFLLHTKTDKVFAANKWYARRDSVKKEKEIFVFLPPFADSVNGERWRYNSEGAVSIQLHDTNYRTAINKVSDDAEYLRLRVGVLHLLYHKTVADMRRNKPKLKEDFNICRPFLTPAREDSA